jgi:3-isopropylmalate/(R)-2-methylmalate dehydratase large subunit
VGLTLFEKIWNDHVIADLGGKAHLLHVDRHFMHEMSGSVAFKGLREANRAVRDPALTFATVDHVPDTFPGRGDDTAIPGGRNFIRGLRAGAIEHKIQFFDLDDERQGIIHVIAPELGIAQPGCLFLCGDSHTCTLGGLGAYAWGLGSTDVEHVLATQCIIQVKPKTMRISFDGELPKHVYPKDLILYLIGRITADGGNGYAIEFSGETIRAMPVEGRLTICNMGIELSAQTAMIAPDDVTLEYLSGRPFSPQGDMWERAREYWRTLPSDVDADFDISYNFDVRDIGPQVTWGTSPEHVTSVDSVVPDPQSAGDQHTRQAMEKALAYTGLTPGARLEGLKIDAAFIGSCTNSRLSDLRAAAQILDGRKVADGVKAICTPGSTQVKRAAEAEGIDKIFSTAGFEWRESGCSLCMSAACRGESFGSGKRVISSTNRNFENRQGHKVSSHLASPATVALSAVRGEISDVRKLTH